MLRGALLIFLLLTSAEGGAAKTTLKWVRVFGGETVILANAKEETGQCFEPSRLITREDAWRCQVNNHMMDPCFIKKESAEAYCLQTPWQLQAIKLVLASPMNIPSNHALDMSTDYPWAVQLVTGEKCLALEDGIAQEGLGVHYRCENETYLIGHVQRCKGQWKMLQKSAEGVHLTALETAWF